MYHTYFLTFLIVHESFVVSNAQLLIKKILKSKRLFGIIQEVFLLKKNYCECLMIPTKSITSSAVVSKLHIKRTVPSVSQS